MIIIDFQTHPSRYRHWRVEIDGAVAHLILDVAEDAGLFPGYDLKLNSYDLGVDIELYDATQRLRFEHPEVQVVILRSGKDRVFCAGANIRMLANAEHGFKVNFCKFTNETRNAIEEAGKESGQKYISVIEGICAGGGYELALATDYIILADDGSAAVSLPEVPLLAVLPGTGGLTRLTDKRRVRRDHADVFATLTEGIKGPRAVQWGLVDQTVAVSELDGAITDTVQHLTSTTPARTAGTGINLLPLERTIESERVCYSTLTATVDRDSAVATITLHAPEGPAPDTLDDLVAQGAQAWLLRCARELDDCLLHFRFNEPGIGVLVFKSSGEISQVVTHDQLLRAHSDHWLVTEIRLYWKRVLKRVDLTGRSLVALVEPGSCFCGLLAEIVLACDRSYMMIDEDGEFPQPAVLSITATNTGSVPMSNGLTRLQTRFQGDVNALEQIQSQLDITLDAQQCEALGLVTFALDEIDWDDEIRVFLEERAAFSPDAMTAMEANLRFAGPETMETKIFGRLSAWQNWIFQRPNAAGENGALRRYGSGQKGLFDKTRT
ncbi:MAG TPA: 2,3-epoxybenzoyl-CoA dihydrolase [Arenicellales bacterium]|nr:2,3-epoxybenzoyl-CoA dihydrolase [Arenicellales bacterium]